MPADFESGAFAQIGEAWEGKIVAMLREHVPETAIFRDPFKAGRFDHRNGVASSGMNFPKPG